MYSHLQYGISAWGNSAARCINKIQVQQNFIVKIITKSSFFKTELNPLYQKLKMLNLNNIYKLEILKFMGKYQNNSLPNCFNDFYALPSKLHSYPTRFATSDTVRGCRLDDRANFPWIWTMVISQPLTGLTTLFFFFFFFFRSKIALFIFFGCVFPNKNKFTLSLSIPIMHRVKMLWRSINHK